MKSQRKAGFGLFRVRSPLLTESRLLSLPPGTEMVHFPGFARTRLWIQRAVTGFCPVGFPHSEIPGSMGASPSPRLIAGSHVLLRRPAPRHPPYALSSLTIKSAQHTHAIERFSDSAIDSSQTFFPSVTRSPNHSMLGCAEPIRLRPAPNGAGLCYFLSGYPPDR